LTPRQREVLRVVRGTVQAGGDVTSAAHDLGISPDAVFKALERMGESQLRARLTGFQPAKGPVQGVAPSRSSGGRVGSAVPRGGRLKTTEDDEGLKQWRARRAAVHASTLERRPRSPASLGFAVDYTEGLAVADRELDAAALREQEDAARERDTILGRGSGG
jgi:hypothetical protein